MSILVNIENEIVHLIGLQKENKRRVEKQRVSKVYTEKMKQEMEPFYERTRESIAHLNSLLIEAGEIRKHFSNDLLPEKVYDFYGMRLVDALNHLKRCEYDFKFNRDFRNFVTAYDLIRDARNKLSELAEKYGLEKEKAEFEKRKAEKFLHMRR